MSKFWYLKMNSYSLKKSNDKSGSDVKSLNCDLDSEMLI